MSEKTDMLQVRRDALVQRRAQVENPSRKYTRLTNKIAQVDAQMTRQLDFEAE